LSTKSYKNPEFGASMSQKGRHQPERSGGRRKKVYLSLEMQSSRTYNTAVLTDY
jgi:hypothetical protein